MTNVVESSVSLWGSTQTQEEWATAWEHNGRWRIDTFSADKNGHAVSTGSFILPVGQEPIIRWMARAGFELEAVITVITATDEAPIVFFRD